MRYSYIESNPSQTTVYKTVMVFIHVGLLASPVRAVDTVCRRLCAHRQ